MAEMKFEQAFEKLEAIMEKLESGELPLEEQLKKYEEGVKLVRTLSERLESAKKKVSKLAKKKDGTFSLEPLEEEEEEST